LLHSINHALLELGYPRVRIFALDPIDQVDPEVELRRFIAQDVLELFANASQVGSGKSTVMVKLAFFPVQHPDLAGSWRRN
jgi:hypothetical protein